MSNRRTVILLLGLIIAGRAHAEDPLADQKAVVVDGEARFTVLTPQLVRMEWSPQATFEDKASLLVVHRKLPVPQFTVRHDQEWLVISTGALTLRYRSGSGRFTAANLSLHGDAGHLVFDWTPGKTDSLNLRGTTRTLDGRNGSEGVQLEEGLLSRSGWALVDDSQRPLFTGAKDWDWVVPRTEADQQDWYFFGYGHDYKKALGDFTRIAGKIPLPPRFAFGYWWSRYWTYSDAELRKLIADMRQYDVPIDVLIVDMDWHETYGLSRFDRKRDEFGQTVGWTGYTWNKNLFPDPAGFLSWTKEERLKTALNLHPASGIAPMESQYGEFAQRLGFDTIGHKNIPFAAEDKKWSQTFVDVVLRPLEKQGVDFWWLDWQAWLENTKIKSLSNTWWLNYVFFTSVEKENKVRPLLFHRWGGLGNHRYQIGFSGDTHITWESLGFQPYFTATASNVGYGYWSHDIGGHMGGHPSSEMYLRWLQYGVFSPILRTHATKSTAIERRIWKHPGYFEAMRDALHLRYALSPYIYTMAREAYDTGVSLCRPLYYEFPGKDESYTHPGEYFFGDNMIVAPVTTAADSSTGLARKALWLPEGDWFEWCSGEVVHGNVERTFALEEIPVYIKAGSVIPLSPKTDNLQRTSDTLMVLSVPGGNGEGKYYEDDGNSTSYKSEQCAWTVLRRTVRSNAVTISASPRSGHFDGMHERRAIEVQLPAVLPPRRVTVNGVAFPFSRTPQEGHWYYEGSSLTLHILTPMNACTENTIVDVEWSAASAARAALAVGKYGLFRRLPRVVEMMKDLVNKVDALANAPSLVLKAGSIVTRINYEPMRAMELLAEFEEEYPALLSQIRAYPHAEVQALQVILDQFPARPSTGGK